MSSSSSTRRRPISRQSVCARGCRRRLPHAQGRRPRRPAPGPGRPPGPGRRRRRRRGRCAARRRGDLEGQAGLAHPAGTGQGQQAHVPAPQALPYGRHLPLPAHEAAQRKRQAHPRRRRSGRRRGDREQAQGARGTGAGRRRTCLTHDRCDRGAFPAPGRRRLEARALRPGPQDVRRLRVATAGRTTPEPAPSIASIARTAPAAPTTHVAPASRAQRARAGGPSPRGVAPGGGEVSPSCSIMLRSSRVTACSTTLPPAKRKRWMCCTV